MQSLHFTFTIYVTGGSLQIAGWITQSRQFGQHGEGKHQSSRHTLPGGLKVDCSRCYLMGKMLILLSKLVQASSFFFWIISNRIDWDILNAQKGAYTLYIEQVLQQININKVKNIFWNKTITIPMSRSSSMRARTSLGAILSAAVTVWTWCASWTNATPFGWKVAVSWSMKNPTTVATSTTWGEETILTSIIGWVSMTLSSPVTSFPWWAAVSGQGHKLIQLH